MSGFTLSQLQGGRAWAYPVVIDVSNYDYDADAPRGGTWDEDFIAAGIAGAIVGSQWPMKAAWQIAQARDSGLHIVGTYAEPDAASAIDLARVAGCQYVGLACERGSILTQAELRADIALVEDAGLTPWLYGNVGDLLVIAGLDLLYQYAVWLASYGTNDPANPRSPITEYDFGRGPRALAAHQFSSTIVVSGRNRDHSYLYLEAPDMSEQEDLVLSVWGAAGEQSLDRPTRLTNARYRMQQAVVGVDEQGKTVLPLVARLAEHVAAHPGGGAPGITEARVRELIVKHKHSGNASVATQEGVLT